MYNKNYKEFGKRIKKCRKENGINSQEEFAQKIGRHIKTIRNWEQGICLPELKDLINICEMLNCSIDYLMGNIDESTHDLHYISVETGLTEQSIKFLQRMWVKYHTKEEVEAFDVLEVQIPGKPQNERETIQYDNVLTSYNEFNKFWKKYGNYSSAYRSNPETYMSSMINEKQQHCHALSALNSLLSHPAGEKILENLYCYLNFEYEPTEKEKEETQKYNSRYHLNYKSVIKGKGMYVDAEYLNISFLTALQNNCQELKKEITQRVSDTD